MRSAARLAVVVLLARWARAQHRPPRPKQAGHAAGRHFSVAPWFDPALKEAKDTGDWELEELVVRLSGNAAMYQENGCLAAWNLGLRGSDAKKAVMWSANSDAHWHVRACLDTGLHYPVFIQALGNDTTYFDSEPVAICLPKVCDHRFLRDYFALYAICGQLWEKYLGAKRRGESELAAELKPSLAKLRRIQRGARIRVSSLVSSVSEVLPGGLDFVIIGYPLSGTTTLARELSRHPRISLPEHEDLVFWKNMHMLEASKRWAQPYLRAAAAKREALEKAGRGQERVLFGLKEPMMVLSPEVMQQIKAVKPAVKVIVLLREPVSAIQSWMNHGADWLDPHGNEVSFWVGLQYHQLNNGVLGAIPPERLLLIPTAAMSLAPKLTMDRIMAFLGLDPWDDPMVLQRRQNVLGKSPACSWVGKCVNFCDVDHHFHNRLKAMLQPDAEAVDRLLATEGWPAHLRGILPLPACPPWVPESGKAKPVEVLTCHAGYNMGGTANMHNPCFQDTEACLSCCDRLEGACGLWSKRWEKCCLGMVRVHWTWLKQDLRQHVCGGRTGWPCQMGRLGTGQRFNSVP